MVEMPEKLKSGLDSLVKKYLPVISITAMETPLHEGLHALTAKIMPHATCHQIALSDKLWYSGLLEVLSLGYCKSAALPATEAGHAIVEYDPDTIGKFSAATSSAVPEIATMALGFYWISDSINKIGTRGQNLYSLVKTYCGMALVSSTFWYMNNSTLNPSTEGDHTLVTENFFQILGIPDDISRNFTFLGTAAMLGASIYLTKGIHKFIDWKNDR
jgi:hypothetical protein